MERWVKKSIELLAGLVFTGKVNSSVIPYQPQKTKISEDEEQFFHRCQPEKVGITSGRLLAMIHALEKEKKANVHNLMVIKDSEVILECSHPGYSVNTWHLSHSMSKTVTGMAVGMLVDDGVLNLNTRLIDLFPNQHYYDRRFAQMTVEHLLTMRSGVKFAESGSITESRWTDAFFNSPLLFTPGTQFNYNSMNTYILAKIVTELSGRSLVEFLDERLFGPLEIKNYFWESGPEGVEKGGWGLYMSCESWAKVGYMMMSGGVFNGKRIISKSWVDDATTAHSVTPDSIGGYNYGYQMWISRDSSNFLFNGMLGQNVWICPRNKMVVSLNSGNNELFQNSSAMAIIEKYLNCDLSNDLSESCFAGDYDALRKASLHFFESRHWIRPYEVKKGINYRLGLRTRRAYPSEWVDILGKYNFAKNNYGILPLFVRTMQNNLKSSIDTVCFENDSGSMYVIFSECGVSYRLEIGFSDFKQSVVEFRGEKYIVNVMGEAMEDEDRNMLFKLELLFPELPNTRMFKFSFEDDGRLLMRMSEMPNQRIADAFIDEVVSANNKMNLAMSLIEKRLGRYYVNKKMSDTFAPSLVGARLGSENYQRIMDEEREKQKANEKTVKLINAMVNKMIKDDSDDEESDTPRKTLFVDILDRIREFIPQKSPDSSGKG